LFSLLATLLVLQSSNLASEYPPASDGLLAAAGPLAERPDIRLRGYDFDGQSFRQLEAVVRTKGPADQHGARQVAVTHGDIGYTFNAGACRPEMTETSVSIVMVLPDHTSRDALSSAERERWDRYFAALLAHEANHVALIEEGAKRIGAAMRSAPNCDAAVEVGADTNAEVQAAHDEYDRRTQHGRTEGVVF
jgi:predicted secreted Zn-dependent protease